ncbi:MAG: type 4a pilus biogenesis protein PilO [Verrucomicrobiae bacterium]|nr:type 4a pilus biogenesis protein PilO [Verrucomicrobiae bacterium]
MRPLTTSEKRLMLVLGLLLFAVANLIVWNYLAARRSELLTERARQSSAQMEHRTWLGQRDLWMQRMDWLEKNQPPSTSPSALLESVQQAAQKHGIEIKDPKLVSPNAQPLYLEIAVGLSAIGTIEKLTSWIAEIQQPGLFRLLKQVVVKPADDKGNLRADVVVAQWCKPEAAPAASP